MTPPPQYPPTKVCSRCREDLPRSEFYKNKGRPDGIQTVCKGCTGALNSERKAANPDWWRPYRATQVLTDAQRRQRDERARRWRQDNPERHKANAERWLAANPEKARAMSMKRSATRRARKAGAFVEYVDPLVVLERADGVCGICGQDVDPWTFQVDHIVPLAAGGEHSYANTQPAHALCNRKKWMKLPEELVA